MPDYQWPDAEHRTLIGKRISRVDSPDKVSGQARYTYDVQRPGLLFGKMLRCSLRALQNRQHRHQRGAEKMPGVKAVEIVQKAGLQHSLGGRRSSGGRRGRRRRRPKMLSAPSR